MMREGSASHLQCISTHTPPPLLDCPPLHAPVGCDTHVRVMECDEEWRHPVFFDASARMEEQSLQERDM